MYGLTRGTATLLGAAVAGLLIWTGTQIDHTHTGGYWAVYGLLAAAGLVMAFSQLLGGWTKRGSPRISLHVLLTAFLPILICVGWVSVAAQPEANWFQTHVNSWSGSLGLGGIVGDLKVYVAVLAFGLGLVFGLVFDTSGPRREPEPEAGPGQAPAAAGEPRAQRRLPRPHRPRRRPEAGKPVGTRRS